MEEDPEHMDREQGEGLVLGGVAALWLLAFSNPDSLL